MTEQQINNRVCEACGITLNPLEANLGGIFCSHCGAYHQKLIQHRLGMNETSFEDRRKQYFKYLET